MIMKKLKCKLVLSLLALSVSGNCFATGLGVTNSVSNELWSDSAQNNVNHDVKSLGFLLDTNESGRKVFGYRFRFLLERNESEDKSVKLEGYATTHDFAFSLFANDHFRMWLGPRLKAARYDDVRVNGVKVSDEVNGYLFGPVFGINVFLDKVVGFSFAVSRLAGDYDSRRNVFNANSTYDIDVYSRTTTVEASLVFRFGKRRFRH